MFSKMIKRDYDIYLCSNMRAVIGQWFFFDTGIVKQVVYEGKFKLFGTSVERAKKFEFARVDHEFDYSSVKKLFAYYCQNI